jgi:hypothetical protein
MARVTCGGMKEKRKQGEIWRKQRNKIFKEI